MRPKNPKNNIKTKKLRSKIKENGREKLLFGSKKQ